MGIKTVSLIIASFVNGSLGIAALMRNFRSRLCIYFGLLAGLLFVHDVLSVLESFAPDGRYSSDRLHVLSLLLLGPVALLLLKEIVPAYAKLLRRFLWAYVPFVILTVLVMGLDQMESYTFWFSYFVHVSFVFPAAVWIVLLFKAQKASTLMRERLRLRLAFWGGVLTLGLFATDALYFIGVPLPPLGTAGRILYLLFIFQSLIQKKLLTLEEAVAKLAHFGMIAFLLTVVYSLLVIWVGDRPGLFFFNSLIASFAIIVLFDPIGNLAKRFTRKLFLSRSVMLEEELNRLSIDLRGMVEPSQLAKRLDEAFRICLGVETSSLYMLDRDELTFTEIDPTGEKAELKELISSSPLVEYIALSRGRPLIVESIHTDRDNFPSEKSRNFFLECENAMRTLNADFIVPFLYETRLVGFCAMTTGEQVILTNDQLRLFIPVSRQVTLLLKNSQIYRKLGERDKLAAVGEMAAGLAHEIKNPLGAIKGAAQLLKGELKEGDQNTTEFLDIILDETDRLSLVLTDFLDYAKPRRDYSQHSCDPLRVVEHTANLIPKDANVTVSIDADKKTYSLEADPERLKQVLLNLFINATHAMDSVADEPTLEIRVREIHPQRQRFPFSDSLPLYKIWEGWEALKDSRRNSFIEIEVRDNGEGIRREDLPRLFHPVFYNQAQGDGAWTCDL